MKVIALWWYVISVIFLLVSHTSSYHPSLHWWFQHAHSLPLLPNISLCEVFPSQLPQGSIGIIIHHWYGQKVTRLCIHRDLCLIVRQWLLVVCGGGGGCSSTGIALHWHCAWRYTHGGHEGMRWWSSTHGHASRNKHTSLYYFHPWWRYWCHSCVVVAAVIMHRSWSLCDDLKMSLTI